MIQPMVSVIVPTYRDQERLTKCVARLLAQSYETARLELIVVNNDPEERVVIEDSLQHDRVRVITEPIAGSYVARNRGAAIARGDILVFTDSDCQPEPDWVMQLVRCFNETAADLVTGLVRMQTKEPKSVSAVEAYDMVTGIRQDVFAREQRGATANLAVTRRQFDRVSGFDSARYSGGDMDFCRRVNKDGGGFAFCEHAVVLHPLRSEWREVLNKARRLAGGKATVDRLELKSSVPRMIAAQFTGFQLIWSASDLQFWQKIKAFGVFCVVKLVQVFEFLRVLLFRKKALR